MTILSLDELEIELPYGPWSGGVIETPKLPGLPDASYVARAYEYADAHGRKVWLHVGPATGEPKGEADQRDRVAERIEHEWLRLAHELGEDTAIDEGGPSFFPGEVYVGFCAGLNEGRQLAILTSALSAESLETTVSVVFLLPYESDEEIPELLEMASEAVDTIALGPA